jgi:hypothetical protein
MRSARSAASRVCTLLASSCASTSHAMRLPYGTTSGVRWWQAIIPHRSPSMTMDTLIDAATPMLVRYSMWIGDTLRSVAQLMSSGSSPRLRTGTGTAPTSAISRWVLMTYRRRACTGMSPAG